MLCFGKKLVSFTHILQGLLVLGKSYDYPSTTGESHCYTEDVSCLTQQKDKIQQIHVHILRDMLVLHLQQCPW